MLGILAMTWALYEQSGANLPVHYTFSDDQGASYADPPYVPLSIRTIHNCLCPLHRSSSRGRLTGIDSPNVPLRGAMCVLGIGVGISHRRTDLCPAATARLPCAMRLQSR